MRTTLTLDDDVAAEIMRLQKKRNAGLKEIVNQTLRAGLRKKDTPVRAHKAFRTKPVNLGRCLIGNVDDVAEALASAEGEDF